MANAVATQDLPTSVLSHNSLSTVPLRCDMKRNFTGTCCLQACQAVKGRCSILEVSGQCWLILIPANTSSVSKYVIGLITRKLSYCKDNCAMRFIYIIVAKSTSGFNSDRIVRQYAHGLRLESPFVPSSTDC